MRVKLDRDLTARLVLASQPDFAVSPLTQRLQQLKPRHHCPVSCNGAIAEHARLLSLVHRLDRRLFKIITR